MAVPTPAFCDVAVRPPADFRGVVFPEWAFPPAAADEAAYRAGCRHGYAVMARSRVAITGLARNIGAILPTTIRRLENLGRCFADQRMIVYENDSTDDTRAQLLAWARADRRVRVISEQQGDPVNPATRCPHRAARMARYRRRCQELVLSECSRFDAVIVVDLDLLGGWSTDGIAHTFGQRDWDFVGSNGLIYRRHGLRMNTARHYDTWALRFDDRLTPLRPAVAGGCVHRRGAALLPVTSCFGGLGIYRMQVYSAGHYAADDLEHAAFHRSLLARGHRRLFLNPSQIVVYGRRHRFGDATIDGALRVWAAVRGRPAPQWQCPAWEAPAAAEPPRRAAA
jgi:hypothetical protein